MYLTGRIIYPTVDEHNQAYKELKAWLAKKHLRYDPWRGCCINYWLMQLDGLAGAW